MSYAVNPLIIVAIVSAIFAFAAGIYIFRSRSTKVRIALATLALVLLVPIALVTVAFNPWLIDARFRTYRSFYKDLQVGMTHDQVMEIAQRHYPQGGKRGFPKVMKEDETNLGFFMNPEGIREPNCEGIFLRLKDGKVTEISYSAD